MPDIGFYQTALQHPELCFQDEELKAARVAMGGWKPLTWAGQFAVVFKLETAHGPRAVRCFYHPNTEHEERYKLFHQHLCACSPNCLIHFEYLPRGILVNEDYYPIVKMEWVEGETLDKRVDSLVERRSVSQIEHLSCTWHDAVLDLQRASIAHGDMQHGNILSQNGSLRLVDYDGIFIPSFQGKKALENGHPNYQHPLRGRSASFDLRIDHFSAFVIYLSLRAIAVDPVLWKRYHRDDYLILKQDDYVTPHKSPMLKALKKSSDSQVKELANRLEDLCTREVKDIPPFLALLGEREPMPVPERKAAAPPSEGQWWTKTIAPSGQMPSVSLPRSSLPVSSPGRPEHRGLSRNWKIALVISFLILSLLCLFLFIAAVQGL